MKDPVRDEFDAAFKARGGIATDDLVESFPHALLFKQIRDLAQGRARAVSADLAETGISRTVFFDLIASPRLDAGACTPRPGVSFIGISLGGLLRSRMLLEVLLSQAHNPPEAVIEAEMLLRLCGEKAPREKQWSFLRDADGQSFIVNDVFEPDFVLISWAYAVDFMFAHELHHVLLGHTEYAERQFGADHMHEGMTLSSDERQKKLRLIELRADYGAGLMLGNRLPNKALLVYGPPDPRGLTVAELMAHASSAFTAIMTAFNIAWDRDPAEKLFQPELYPHPDFRYRMVSEGVAAELKRLNRVEDRAAWLGGGGSQGHGITKGAFAKILGPAYEVALQTGPVFGVPRDPWAAGMHHDPHSFSQDAERLYRELREEMPAIDQETDVTFVIR